jgi:hypothetical protein
VCARILAAAEPAAAAHAAAQALEGDRTADRLGATLPLLDDGEVVAFIGWTDTVDTALVERFDLDVVAIRVEGSDPVRALRRRRTDHAVRVVDPWDPALERVARLVVSALAIGPDHALVPAGSADALATIGTAAREIWLVGGVGHVLPGRLYDVVASATAGDAPTKWNRSRSNASTAWRVHAASNARPTRSRASTVPSCPSCCAR